MNKELFFHDCIEMDCIEFFNQVWCRNMLKRICICLFEKVLFIFSTVYVTFLLCEFLKSQGLKTSLPFVKLHANHGKFTTGSYSVEIVHFQEKTTFVQIWWNMAQWECKSFYSSGFGTVFLKSQDTGPSYYLALYIKLPNHRACPNKREWWNAQSIIMNVKVWAETNSYWNWFIESESK